MLSVQRVVPVLGRRSVAIEKGRLREGRIGHFRAAIISTSRSVQSRYLQPLLLTGEDALPFPNSPSAFAGCSCESDQHHITMCTSPSSFLDYLTVRRSWATF